MVSVPKQRLKAADMTGSDGNGNGNGHAPQLTRPTLAGGWSDSARRVLRERYLWKRDGAYLEDEDGMCWRVATAVAAAETAYGGNVQEAAEAFYELMVTGKYLPNSPTLMNAGKNNGLQLSACFVLPVEDTIDGIFDAVKYAAIIHKSGGGCIAGDARVWTTFCGIEPIEVLFHRATVDGRTGTRQGAGIAYDVRDLGIRTVSMNPYTGETGLRPVSHVWQFDVPGENQLVVTLREGTTVQTSDWHPFMVVRGTELAEVRADALIPGDVILGAERPDGYWPWSEYRTVGALEITPALGWLIGFTLGDGSFGYVPSLRQYRVRWFSGTEDVLHQVQAVLAERAIHVSVQTDARGLHSVATLNQRFVHDLLEACGLETFGAKDTLVRVPEVIAKSPLPVVRAFLAGLLDSDGYVAPDGSPSYTSVSEAMAEDVAALVSLLGYQPTVKAKAPSGKGRHTTYTVQLCPLPQVNDLADDLRSYLAHEGRRERLHSTSRKQTALHLSFRAWRDRLITLGLVKERGDKSTGAGLCAEALNRWSCNENARCRRDDLRHVAACVALVDEALGTLLRRIATTGQEVSQITRATTPKPYYDLSVEGWNTYAAGRSGLAMIHNTGFSFSRLRPEGSTVGTSQGVASGPVSFMRIFDAATEQVKQGGTRRGANMGILRVDHPDVEKFITCKIDGGVTNFNISVAATDPFMQAVKEDGEYDLIEPHTGAVVGHRRARAIWDQIVDAAWRSGDPGFVFIDRANNSRSNPTPEIEQLEATNPCGEQWLGPFDACNLGSINLAAVTKRVGDALSLDWEELERVTRLTVRFLDDVIDVNPLPLPQITEKVRANRRIGLGVMGWADLLFLLGIAYDSEQALTLGDEIMAKIEEWGWGASRELAAQRGAFPNFDRSIYADGPPARNATVTTVAPTGSISILADCSSGIEPIFALAFQHRVKQGSDYRVLTFVNPIFKADMERRGLWNDELEAHLVRTGSAKDAPGLPEDVRRVYVTAQEIAPEWHVRQQAAWQGHVDNSISKTVNLPNDATLEDVSAAYLSAYDLGCKGITVFRDGCKSEQVLNIGVQSAQPAVGEPAPAPQPALAPAPATIKPRPDVVYGYTRHLTAPEGHVNVTINSDDDGPLEVFVTIGRAGSDIAAMAEGIGRLISLSLRLPSNLNQNERAKVIAEQLRGIGGSRSVGFGPAQVRSLPDAVGKAIAMHFGESVTNGHTNGTPATTDAALPGAGHAIHTLSAVGVQTSEPSGNLCPQCGSAAFVLEEGCKKCHACGYSEC